MKIITCIKLALPMLICTAASAQKLPGKQVVSVRAPATIKTDGRLAEWAQLQAYNKATEVNYTVANDDENLYFTIQATKPDIAEKIAFGGITFNIINLDKKNPVAITFPKYEFDDTYHLNLKNRPDATADTLRNRMQLDSFIMEKNRQMAAKFKLIEVEGLKDIAPIISVYNDDKIKIATRLDNKLSLVYELAIPLKYIKALTNTEGKFSYAVKLNGAATNHYTMAINSTGKNVLLYDTSGKPVGGFNVGGMAEMASSGISFPTDFTGEYTLAKQ